MLLKITRSSLINVNLHFIDLKNYFSTKNFNVAIIGSGPSGFYTAHRMVKNCKENVKLNLDFFEKLPTPYGLSRSGVSPDNYNIKKCEKYLDDLLNKNNDQTFKHMIRFFGNVNIGKDIKLQTLEKHYHSIIIANGCVPVLNKIEPCCNQYKNVISADKIVSWYNRNPEPNLEQRTIPFLENVKNVTIIGNGNVAFDIVRILFLDSLTYWRSTDICLNALNTLKKCKIKNINIFGRRGVLESAFTTDQLRKLLKCFSEHKINFKITNSDCLNFDESQNIPLKDKRKIELLKKFSTLKSYGPGTKTLTLNFWKSPVEFLPIKDNPTFSFATKFVHNQQITDDLFKTKKLIPTNTFEIVENDFVVLSTGYSCTPLEEYKSFGIFFQDNKISNVNGRVMFAKDCITKNKRNWYVTGWAKNGPHGSIPSNMIDSYKIADMILHDFYNDNKSSLLPIFDPSSLNNHDIYFWNNWMKINEYEKNKGKKINKKREKILSLNKMKSIGLTNKKKN